MNKLSTTTSIIVVLAILVVLNLISINVFGRLDLTDNRVYSLSDASKDLMRNLNDRVVVKCYFTEDLPPPYNQNARYLKDQLEDYRAYSGGRLEFEFADPLKEEREQEAQSYQVPPVQVNAYENDRLEIKKVYMGVVFLHEDKTEVLPVLQSTVGLEYEISRAIKKVTESRMPRIAFSTGHGEPDFNQGLRVVNQALMREFNVQQLDLTDQTSIPGDVDALFVVAPQMEFSEWSLYLLDQYLMRGGKLGIFLSTYNCDIQTNNSTPIDAGLDSLLKSYGIGVEKALAMDARCSRIGVQQQSGAFRIQNMVEYRYFPLLSDFSDDNLIVKGLDEVAFIFPSPLDTTVMLPSGVKREIIARTSEYSRVEREPFDLSPFREFRRSDFDRQHLPLGATLKGVFPSHFANRGMPTYTGTDTSYIAVESDFQASSDSTRMIVVGNGGFVDDRSMNSQSNLVLFMNMVDWLSQDEGLISIRSKQVDLRPLDDIPDSTKKIVKYSNLLAMPVIVIIVGLIRWRTRAARKHRVI